MLGVPWGQYVPEICPLFHITVLPSYKIYPILSHSIFSFEMKLPWPLGQHVTYKQTGIGGMNKGIAFQTLLQS